MNKTVKRICSLALGGLMVASICPTLAGCKDPSKKSSIVIMTEELSGLFNPFYATSGTDMDVVGMTQIGMLSTDSEGNPTAGDDQSTVVKAFEVGEHDEVADTTTYRFVIKNGLKFSDGKPLTMNDVMFNIYEYLDPVYTGSSTMYSIDIVGLQKYRLQEDYSDGGSAAADSLSKQASQRADLRIQEMIDVYTKYGKQGSGANLSYYLSEEDMRNALNAWSITPSYKLAVSSEKLTDAEYRAQLLEDYQFTLDTFKDELEADFNAAKESYDLTTLPYSEWKKEMSNDIFKFFLYEGYITPIYQEVNGKKNKLKITGFDGEVGNFNTKEKAIERVYTATIESKFIDVLSIWGTAGTLKTKYTADALDVILHDRLEGDELKFKSIDGIVSLGHNTDLTTVRVDGVDYAVAREHNPDGTPANANEYDVLQITINGCDPKAIYNFGFTVAPAHYYGSATGDGTDVQIDIENHKFGVPWSDSHFQSKVIQSQQHVEVPMGAGPYQATNRDNATNPSGASFWSNSVVYFKANDNFMFDVKTEKLRMQVVSSSNALDKLESGEVDYVTPQFTKENADRLEDMDKKGYKSLSAWQLGYGYIGINAGKVKNVYVRRSIMAAMQTSLACDYYTTGTVKTISWPMSTVSWAYPYEDRKQEKEYYNNHPYTYWEGKEAAISKIEDLMAEANATKDELEITFTIAGASITEHPTYAVFRQAAEILNELGWNVEVKADSQALTKLSTGSLEVWAAAWGSTVDPDMYQVYHKDSTATSVYAWGYREIKSEQSKGDFEYDTIELLSEKIEAARETLVQSERTTLYKEAMEYVLDLAVELPVYQRMTLYAYNSKTISGLKTEVNHYSSPLEKIWELELVD